jgi:hypothetical protein
MWLAGNCVRCATLMRWMNSGVSPSFLFHSYSDPFSLLKPYLRVFQGLSKTNLPGYVGFFQFLRNFRHQTACEQAEMILQAALDPTIATRARRGEFVESLDHFDLLQTAIN